ncbi:MAG: hypothetical protein LBF41_10440, partial [Deltaproteobacteria bacterium]|nr:hypothetical protein [Deltaproteobacteria bacterium]
ATAGVALPNPLFLAAKYGGFVDHNSNGLPDPGEWEGSDGVTPRNYFEASNITELPSKLEDAFKDIARSISTGTATSASVDTILGGGVSVQTLYYPLYVNPDDSSQSLRWVGLVFGLFVDKWGNLREDNHDPGVLDPVNGEDGSEGDYVVTFNSTREESANPPKCYEFGSHITRCYTPDGSNNPKPFEVLNDRHPANIHRIKPLFDTGRWLSRLDDAKLLSGSRPERSPANLVGGRRRIFYGAPSMNAAGIPETVLAPFTLDAAKELSELMLHDNFFDQLPGHKDKVEAAKALVTWITGVDVPGLRSREVGDPWTDNATPVTWRLGDVINSKPILVGAPASHYDLLYNDPSYLAYKNAWSRRRQMVYFGGNDGMLHAVNVGFYGSLANGKVSFTESDPKDPSSVAHELGAELWAYIPTSLLPHLQWLPDPEYNHAYYVDLKPLVNDVKINGEWRTVLIGGLRLGGRPIEAPDPAVNNGERIFYAEVFALDITDPERDPKLLWRYSTLEQGLTVGMPSVISSEGKWYAIVPSGPLTDYELYYDKVNPLELGRSPYEGASKQRAKLSVLDAATGVELPHWGQNPDYLTADMDMSFFNNPFLPVAQKQENPWTNHTLYYGLTVTQSPDFCEDKGAVYRLQTVDEVTGNPLPTASWKLRKLFDTEKPVTGAVNSTYDNRGNLWVLFATGRLWTSDDINPCSTTSSLICVENHRQYLFGIKEDLNSAGRMTFKDMTGDAGLLVDVSGGEVHKNGGLSGVSPVSRIEGLETPPTSYAAFAKILKSPKTIGYKRRLDAGHLFDGTSSPNYSTATATLTYSTAVAPSLVAAPTGEHDYEMVITQPKLFTTGAGVSLMAFTSFEPKKSGCGDIGNGYLYLVDTFTGLPEPSTFGVYYSGDTPPPSGLAPDRVMGVISTGPGTPTEAFVTMGADGITVSASAPDFTISSIFLPDRDDPPNKVTSWKEVLDTGFVIPPDVMTQGLN